MPQLDKVSFLTQFFWLCVFFLGFYILTLKYFLPQMSRILKYRKKRLNFSNQGVNTMQEENQNVRHSTDKVIEDGLKNTKEIFKTQVQRTQNWLLEYTDQYNQTNLKDTNYAYLYSIGERSLSQKLSLQGSFRDFSDRVFLTILLLKIQKFTQKKGTTLTSKNKSKK